jgi:hypothetical protein
VKSPRQRRPLVELAVDLPVELADTPSAAKRLGLVEAPTLRVPNRKQADVVRPGQGKARSHVGDTDPAGGLSRQRLDYSGRTIPGRLPRSDLDRTAVREVERPHLKQVRSAKPAAEPLAEVEGQSPDEFLTVRRPRRAPLLLLHDPATDRPVGGRHDRVDRARGHATGGRNEAHDIRQNGFVAGIGAHSWGPRVLHA